LRKRPQPNNRNCQQRRDHDGSPPPDSFRPGPKENSPQQRPDIVNNRDETHRLGSELQILLQECGVKVLRAVTERIEGEHEHDEKNEYAGVRPEIFARASVCGSTETILPTSECV